MVSNAAETSSEVSTAGVTPAVLTSLDIFGVTINRRSNGLNFKYYLPYLNVNMTLLNFSKIRQNGSIYIYTTQPYTIFEF